jgi:hypothetical protein
MSCLLPSNCYQNDEKGAPLNFDLLKRDTVLLSGERPWLSSRIPAMQYARCLSLFRLTFCSGPPRVDLSPFHQLLAGVLAIADAVTGNQRLYPKVTIFACTPLTIIQNKTCRSLQSSSALGEPVARPGPNLHPGIFTVRFEAYMMLAESGVAGTGGAALSQGGHPARSRLWAAAPSRQGRVSQAEQQCPQPPGEAPLQKSALIDDQNSCSTAQIFAGKCGGKILREYLQPSLERVAAPTKPPFSCSHQLMRQEAERSSRPLFILVLLQIAAVWWTGNTLHGLIRLLDTAAGGRARALLAAGARLGASARSWSSLALDERSGTIVVQPDMRLITCGPFSSLKCAAVTLHAT